MCLEILLTRCRAWLTSKPRQHSRDFLNREFHYHVASLLLLFVAYTCNFTGLILHAMEFRTDLATFRTGTVTMVTFFMIIVLLILLISYRYQRYVHGYRLACILYNICGILFIVVCFLNGLVVRFKTLHLSNLFLLISLLVCILSIAAYVGPAIGANDTQLQQDSSPRGSPQTPRSTLARPPLHYYSSTRRPLLLPTQSASPEGDEEEEDEEEEEAIRGDIAVGTRRTRGQVSWGGERNAGQSTSPRTRRRH